MREDGEKYNLLCMQLCSKNSYDNYLLLAFSGTVPFYRCWEAENGATIVITKLQVHRIILCSEHRRERDNHWILEAAIRPPFYQKCRLDGFKSRSNLKALIKSWAVLQIKCWGSKCKPECGRRKYSSGSIALLQQPSAMHDFIRWET